MARLMVQGDRDASGIDGALRRLGKTCKECDIGLNVGESGEIVRILTATGADVRVHKTKADKANVANDSFCNTVDCITPAQNAIDNLRGQTVVGLGSGLTEQRLAWAIRLAALEQTSNGFIFFHGREGTLAHLIPVMAFIKKGEVDKGVARPRRVALVDWEIDDIIAIARFFRIKDIFSKLPQKSTWVRSYQSSRMYHVLNWLTDGLPA